MSEIRTLRDGDIDILPRTVASAVQTADGSTVEDKVNSIEAPDLSAYATVAYVDGQIDTLESNISTINNELSGKAKRYIYNSTLSTTWLGSTAPYTQTINVSGILTSDTPHIAPVFSADNDTAIAELEAWAMVNKAVTNSGSITFTCFKEKPATAINLQIEVIR